MIDLPKPPEPMPVNSKGKPLMWANPEGGHKFMFGDGNKVWVAENGMLRTISRSTLNRRKSYWQERIYDLADHLGDAYFAPKEKK